MKNIIGHKSLTELFSRLLKRDLLSHAYIFSGPDHVGKKTFAENLIKEQLGVDRIDAHPDVNRLLRTPNPKTGKMRESIAIDQVQSVCQRLNQSAAHGGYKFLLVEDADIMSIAAANAMLKTLEEPRGRTCIILIASKISSLLPTIISRSQTMRFKTVPREEIRDALKERGVPREDARVYAGLSMGRPGIALRLSFDEEYRNAFFESKKRVERCFSPRIPERIIAVHDMMPAYDADHVKTRNALQERVELFELLARDQLLIASGTADLAIESSTEPKLTTLQARDALRAASEIKRRLSAHIDPNLTLIQAVMSY
jgi:DNA polymerase III subunit delta'